MKGRGGPPSTLRGAPSPPLCAPLQAPVGGTHGGISPGRAGRAAWSGPPVSAEQSQGPGGPHSRMSLPAACTPLGALRAAVCAPLRALRGTLQTRHIIPLVTSVCSGTRSNIFPLLPPGSPRPRPSSSPSLPPALWRPPQGARPDPCLYGVAARGSARQTPAPSLNPLTRGGGTEHDGPGSVAVTGGLSGSRQQRRRRRSARGLAPWEPLAPVSPWRV